MIILDFDGTMVEHQYPLIGKPVPDALRVLRRLVQAGRQITLNTYRADLGCVKDAVDYLKANDIPLYYVRSKKVEPIWNRPMKGDIFIDDVAVGIPLLHDSIGGYMVDWNKLEFIMEVDKVLPPLATVKYNQTQQEDESKRKSKNRTI